MSITDECLSIKSSCHEQLEKKVISPQEQTSFNIIKEL